MPPATLTLEAVISSCRSKIDAAIAELAETSERITGQQFDLPYWRECFPELLNDCLQDAINTVEAESVAQANHEYAEETAADVRWHHARVL